MEVGGLCEMQEGVRSCLVARHRTATPVGEGHDEAQLPCYEAHIAAMATAAGAAGGAYSARRRGHGAPGGGGVAVTREVCA